jgi:hypothetical protein
MLPFPVMDTSTGRFTDCPSADRYKKRTFYTTNPIGFTHRWLHARAILLGATPTNGQGSQQFPNIALFTTLPGCVRLSQSVGCKTNTSVLDNLSENRKDRVSIFASFVIHHLSLVSAHPQITPNPKPSHPPFISTTF